MKKTKYIALLLACSFPTYAVDGRGKIMNVFFSGSTYGAHPNIVQFKIEGGFNKTGCNQVYAAVRSEDSHLVSAILAAKIASSVVEVYLNVNDIYYNVVGNEPNRCIVSAVSLP